MIKHILVVVDGSEYSSTAISYGLYLSKRLHANLYFQHVIDIVFLENPFLHDISGAMGFEPFIDFSGKVTEILKERGKQILLDAEKQCNDEGLKCTTYLDTGIVTKEICEREKLVDMVIVGQKGVNAQFDRKMLGSTTEGLSRRTTKPLFICPKDFKDINSIMLAYDDSNAAKNAIGFAASFCKELNLRLSVITINKDETSGREILSKALSYIQPYNINYETIIKNGSAEKELTGIMTQDAYDLLIMGSHGHSRIVEMVLGSTAEYVIRNTAKPVIVVKA